LVGGGAQAGERETEEVTADVVARGFGASLVGAKRGDDLKAALRDASIFVLPSHLEGQPIAILEAMAAGLPVVATRVGAVPDVVRDGVEGRLVEPGDRDGLSDALAELIADADARTRLGAAARQRCEERFSIDRLRARLAALYASAAGAP
jgi:glycosyltransferase involved in cell wall biosynthesis